MSGTILRPIVYLIDMIVSEETEGASVGSATEVYRTDSNKVGNTPKNNYFFSKREGPIGPRALDVPITIPVGVVIMMQNCPVVSGVYTFC